MLSFIKNIIENIFNIKVDKKESKGINVENSTINSPLVNGNNNTVMGNTTVKGNTNTIIGSHQVSGHGNVIMGQTRRNFTGDHNIMIG